MTTFNFSTQDSGLHKKRHPEQMGEEEIRQFLSHLAVEGNVSASTQNVALCALLFLYRDVLQVELPYVAGITRAKRPTRLPVVFTRREVEKLLAQLSGSYGLIAGLLYGAGLRLMEAVRLRVKDVDFEYVEILVRDGKGEKDRRTILPRPLSEPLRRGMRWSTTRRKVSALVPLSVGGWNMSLGCDV
jgi:integrase